MHTLTSKNWLDLAKLWSDLADHHLHQPEQALAHMCAYMRKKFSVYQVNCSICIQDRPPEGDPLNGWSPTVIYYDPLTSQHCRDINVEWAANMENILGDECCLKHMRTAGRSRVSWRPQLLGETPWSKTSAGELMAQTEVRDRIHIAVSITSTLEVVFSLDAHLSQREFNQSDFHMAQALLLGLRPLSLRLALSHGLLEGHGRLSPRERETLLLLLKGGSEKEIAEALGLSPKTLHQYVVSLYRKFNVRSRPELMALWLEPKHSFKSSHDAYTHLERLDLPL